MDALLRQTLVDAERAAARYRLTMPQRGPMGLTGTQLAQHAGASLEFMDHRDYQPGDDLRRIDWNAYARSDRLTIKLYRDEVSPHADIIVDTSRSMALAETAKAQAAMGVTAMFAAAASGSGFTHCAYHAGENCEALPNGRMRPAAWGDVEFDDRTSPDEGIRRRAAGFRSQGVRVFISDLLWPGDPFPFVRRLADGAAMTIIVQLLAASDLAAPPRGNFRLIDSESDELVEVFVDAGAQSRYRQALQQHQQNWSDASRKLGAVMSTMVAEQVVDGWDLKPLVDAEVLRIA